MDKNKPLIFCGAIALSLGLMFLGAWTSKDNRYQIKDTDVVVSESQFKALKKPAIKVQSNLTFLAAFFLLLAVPLPVLAYFIAENRLVEIEVESEEYAREKGLRQIRTQTVLDTEKQICDINRTAAVSAHTQDIKKAYVELGQASQWLREEPPAKRELEPALTQEVETQATLTQDTSLPQIDAPEAEKKTPNTPGQQLLVDLAYSNKSMLVTGSTGAGKSHTLSAWLEAVYAQARAKNQIASVWILGRKDDSFCGLREAGRLTKFKPFNPEESFKLIKRFYENYAIRVEEASEEERKQLPPLRLILEDWSIVAAVFKDYYPKLWTKIKLMLLDIITVGREYNVCLLILAQSLNLEALGLVGDANLRANMAIVAQGLITEVLDAESGETKIQGDYGLVYLAIKNQYIVPDNQIRKIILATLNELVLESKLKQIPIFFTTLGGANIGLLPHIEKAFISLTHEERDEPIEFDIERFRKSLIQQEQQMGFQSTQVAVLERPETNRDETVAYLNRLYAPEEINQDDIPEEAETSEMFETPETPVSEDAETLKHLQGGDCENKNHRFTNLDLDRETAKKLISNLRNETKLNQTKIIWTLWGARPGESKAYEIALSQYKDLTAE